MNVLKNLIFLTFSYRNWIFGICVFLQIFANSTKTYSQVVNTDYIVKKYTTETGLNTNLIMDVNVDRNGYVWIATQSGLSRFDGQFFIHYSQLNVNYLSSNRFLYINKQKDGTLFILNESKQLLKVDSNSNLIYMKHLKFGYDFLLSHNSKIIFTKPHSYLQTTFKNEKNYNKKYFYVCSDTSVYITEDKLIVYKSQNGIVKENKVNKILFTFFNNDTFIVIDHSKNLYLYKMGQLIGTLNLEKLINQPLKNELLHFSYTGTLASFTYQSMVYNFYFKNGNLMCNKLDFKVNSNDRLTCVSPHISNSNLYFLYSKSDGLFIVKRLMFKNIQDVSIENTRKEIYRVLTNRFSDVFSHNSQKKYMNGCEVKVFNAAFNKGFDTIVTFYKDSVFVFQNGKCKFQKVNSNNNRYKLSIHEDVYKYKNKYYLITDEQVYRINDNLNLTFEFSLSNCVINTICKRNNSSEWLLGVKGKGLILYDQVKQLKTEFGFSKNKDIRYIQYDSLLNIYWIFTYGSGIYWLDDQLKMTVFQKDRNTNLNYAHYYLQDKKLNYWIPTNNGLFRFKYIELKRLKNYPQLNIFYNYYNSQNGIINSEFNGCFSNSGLELPNGVLAFSNMEGIVTVNPQNIEDENIESPILIDNIFLNGRPLKSKNFIQADEGFSKLLIKVSTPNFQFNSLHTLEFRIPNLVNEWTPIENNTLELLSLSNGMYQIQFRKRGDENINNHQFVKFIVNPPWYASKMAYFIYGLLLVLSGIFLSKIYFRTKQRKIQTELSLLESELKALRAQINPHYLSNSLISLQNSILEGNHDKSLQFISMFNKVMRNILINSEKNMTSIEGELKIIKDYIALENINREQTVELLVKIDNPNKTDLNNILIPTNIIQPIVENAFIHGFSEVLDRDLKIQMNLMVTASILKIEIIDNGKGFYPSTKRTHSFGLKNIELVIHKLQLKYKKTTNFKILNRLDESGTQVIIVLPIITNAND